MRANRPDEQDVKRPAAQEVAASRRTYRREAYMEVSDEEQPRYVISVAAQVLGVHPQTLRLYEREGLVEPGRTGGKIRLYSEHDLDRVRRIMRLTNELGVNLAGAEAILNMRERMLDMRQELERMHREMEGVLDEYRRLMDVEG